MNEGMAEVGHLASAEAAPPIAHPYLPEVTMWYTGTSPAAATAVLLTFGAAACGNDLGAEPDVAILSLVSVSPSTATLFTVAPSNAVKLAYEAKDQRGDVIAGVASVSFSSDNQQVAQVDAGGMIQARAVGSATVTTSVTLNGVTRSAQTAVMVVEAPESAVVDAPERTFTPRVAHVRAGGRVTWRMGNVRHDVVFTTAGAPEDIPRVVNVSESRRFPNNGTFDYECTLHAGMTGTVQVH
jgi:plastocyanin